MDAGALGQLESLQDIPGHSEIRVLVDALRNQTLHFLAGLENVRERSGDARGRLHRRVRHLPRVVPLLQSEYPLQLVVGHQSLHLAHRRVQLPHVFRIQKHECLLHIETHRQYVLHVLVRHLLIFLQIHLLTLHLLMEKLLIVAHHYHHCHVESFLQIFCKNKWQ